MALRHYTYLDIPKAVRAHHAQEGLQRAQSIMADPLSSEEQRAAARARHDQLRQWVSGTLSPPPEATPPPEPAPADAVGVSEELSVSE